MSETIELINRYDVDDFIPIHFVSAAVEKDGVRPALNYIKVKDGAAIASDSHRLHEVTNTELKDGFYAPIKRLKTKVVLSYEKTIPYEFPDMERVKPDLSVYDKYDIPSSVDEAFVAFCILKGAPLNYKFLLDIAGRVHTLYIHTYYKAYSPVVFTGENSGQNYYAAVVPLNGF